MQLGQRWFSARSLWTGGGAALATAVMAPFVPGATGWGRWGLVALVGVLALVGWAVPAARAAEAETRKQVAEDTLLSAAVNHRVALSDALLPMLSAVVNAADPTNSTSPDVAVAGAIRMALSTAVELCGRRGGEGRVRACWYEGQGLDTDDPALCPAAYVGRGVKPSTQFRRNELRGQALFELLSDDRTELFHDLDVEKPANWKATAHGHTSYRTFLAVPVRTDDQVFGILTVDGAQPYLFTSADVDLVRVLAVALALPLSQQVQHTATVAHLPSAQIGY